LALTGGSLSGPGNLTVGGTLSVTGTITPSQTAGIVGTTTNNNANAGSVGEQIISNKLTNVAMTSAVLVNVTSISLTAGDGMLKDLSS
jgi:hypothetical protein